MPPFCLSYGRQMTLAKDRVGLRDQLQTGRRELITRFP
jgi:hypothetical protein